MSDRDTKKSVRHPFLKEVIIRKQRDGDWAVEQLGTNRGDFELLDEAKQECNTELTRKFIEYVKSVYWQDIVNDLSTES